MRLRLPQRRLWRGAIYLGALVLILIAIDLMLVQVRRKVHLGFLTTRIVEPKMSDGRVVILLPGRDLAGQDLFGDLHEVLCGVVLPDHDFCQRVVGGQT